jgi:hypothetical protein
VGNGVPTWDFYQDELDIVSWGTRISSYPHAPLVHSISWGSGESNYDADTLAKSNAEFLKLGTMGFSVFCAAGDAGTGHTGVFQCGHFDPTFPASSPYVVAVGGTFVQVAGGNETAWSGTGGGFSAVYARPPYQAAAAASYLAQPGLPSTQFYNSSGRVLPDVAALATNYQVLVENYLGPLTGTSAATPVWAALVAVFNGARAARGMPPMGFVNPWLYQVTERTRRDAWPSRADRRLASARSSRTASAPTCWRATIARRRVPRASRPRRASTPCRASARRSSSSCSRLRSSPKPRCAADALRDEKKGAVRGGARRSVRWERVKGLEALLERRHHGRLLVGR